MTRIAWATDIHYNFADEATIARFHQEINAKQPDAFLIAGDIGESDRLFGYLTRIGKEIACPVYFVLGNHDFYRGSMGGVRQAVMLWSGSRKSPRYLPEAGVVPLSAEVGLVGDGGWGDGVYGDFLRSNELINDYLLIEEFQNLSRPDILATVRKLGLASANALRPRLEEAASRFPNVIVVTHVPPYVEASCKGGKPGITGWTPHYSCGAMGAMLTEVAAKFPACSMLVLCGHTHVRKSYRALPNLLVRVGEAEYKKPRIQEVFELL